MKFNKIYAVLAAVALAGGFASCSDDDNEYSPAAATGNAEVYFDRDETTTINLTDGQTEIPVPVYRVHTDEALTVNISSVNPTGIFTVPQSISFEAGSNTTELMVTLDWDQVEGQVDYMVTLVIDQAQTSPYGLSQITLNASYAPWSEWEPLSTGGGNYTSGMFNFGGPLYFPEIMVRHSLLDEISGSKNDAGEWEHLQYGLSGFKTVDDETLYSGFMFDEEGMLIINRNAKTNAVTIPLCPVGYTHAELGDLYLYSPASLGSTFNPETGLFTIKCYYLNIEGYGWSADDLLQLDGYADFTVTMVEGGHYIDANGTDHQVVMASFTEDVSSVKYVLVSGTPTAEEVAAAVENIQKGELETQELTAPGAMSFAIDEKGKYTVIAVAYDESGKAVGYNTFTFAYRPFTAGEEDPNEGWNSLGYCRYTDDTFMYMFIAEGNEVPVPVYSVEIQESQTEPGLYRLVNPYGAAYPFNEPGDYNADENHYLMINATDPDGVFIEDSPTSLCWDASAGSLSIWSLADYLYASGQATREQIKASGEYCGKLENGVITFPAETLMVLWSNMSGKYWAGNIEGKWKVDMTNLTAEPGEPELASLAVARSLQVRGGSIGYSSVRYYQGSPLNTGRRTVFKKEISYLPLN